MNKIYKLLVPALAVATALPSCSDLDTVPMDQNLTAGQKEQVKSDNPDMALAGVTGVAGLFNVYMSVLERHDDFGYPSVMLFSDASGVDMVGVNSGYNWFAEGGDMSYATPLSDRTNITWGVLYNQIFAANAVLSEIDHATTDPSLQFFLAQGYAFRAFDYLILAQSYQLPYATHRTSPCVMLITEENAERYASTGCPRSSVEDTYKLITSDLDRAIELLEECDINPSQVIESSPKRFVSLAVAHGLRARAALVMADYEAAAEHATQALAHFSGSPLSLAEAAAPGFNSINAANWMWGIPVAETDRVVTSGIINFPSHMGSLTYGYASVGAYRSINRALWESIPASDVRKGWFLDSQAKSPNLSAEAQSYVDGNKIPAFAQVKFAPYQNQLGTNNNASDIPLMRVEELYLTLAEATAMSGSLDDGKQVLEQFVRNYRDPEFASTAASAQELQDEVFQQRRVELWGEGLTTYDFLRLNKPLDRRGGMWPSEWCFNVPAGSDLLIMPIPNSEVQGNEAFRVAGNNNPTPSLPVAVTDVTYPED